MAKNLVIVESPTKAKTLERYLGAGYSVKASFGHIRDLPKNRMGVNTERDFAPEYVVPDGSKKAVAGLKAAHKRSDDVFLATDFDREGEAIAFHVAEVLGVDPEHAKRVTFTEITESAVRAAFRHPRTIDLRLVEAQQARRILDRLVGYNISPLLWKKVRQGLSAGRVQSVALRLVVDREREIEAFDPQEWWSVDARLSPDGDEQSFLARLTRVDGRAVKSPTEKKRGHVLTGEAAREHAANLERATYRVADVARKEVKRRPAPPFTTSTLQQEAARKLGFSSKKTMAVAQQLYEGVDLPGEGPTGLITYMRTDSVHIAAEARRELRSLIEGRFGATYVTVHKPHTTRSRGAQEAHEAIRPTKASRLPEDVEAHLTRDQARLYRLVWQRSVASQMSDAVFDRITVDVNATAQGAPAYVLRATGQTVKFDGFRRVYLEGRDDTVDEDAEALLPELEAEQALRLLGIVPEQHFTSPPPRYTEASLVKELEKRGIGRPSTYAPTISTLVDRQYVRIEDKRLYPEEVGVVVTDLLVEHFPEIVDYDFTARLEEELDEIAEGRLGWVQVLDEFYGPFERLLEKKHDEIERPGEEIDELCPLCPQEGREPGQLMKKFGKAGWFIGCSNWPACAYTRDVDGQERPDPKETDERCPECGAPMLLKTSRFGDFLGCSRYPDCKGKKSIDRTTGVRCPQCGEGDLVVKRTRRGRTFYGCSRYPDCEFAVWQRPVPEPCPVCGNLMVETAKGTKCTECGHVVERQADPATAG